MRFASLTDELNSITKDYDYGIVPGSAAVFVKDEVMGIGRLDLTLLEGVMVVIEVSNQGYKIASSSPLSDDPVTLAAAEQVQACVERESFETMENLLMTASPLFRERFQSTLYDKLHQVQQLQLMSEEQRQQYSSGTQQHQHDYSTVDGLSPTRHSSNPTSSATPNLEQQHSTTGQPGLPPDSASSPILLSSPSSSLSDSYYHKQHTNLLKADPSSSSAFNSHTTSSLDQQDLLDEINQWIH